MDADSSKDANSPNLEQLMQIGIQTARKGNKQSARMIFQQILDADKQNERAWLWMAAVAEAPEERARYLNTVLRLNPNNQTAQKELQRMQARAESSNTRVLRYGFIGLGVIVALVTITICLLLVIK
jgi:thioredoxin-like negative regulator of GroEL